MPEPGNQPNTTRLRTIFSVAFLSVFFLITGLSFYSLYHSPVLGVKASWDGGAHRWKVQSAVPPFRTGDVLVSIEGRPVGLHEWLTDNIYIESRKELIDWFRAKMAFYSLLSRPSVTVGVVRDGRPTEISAPVHQARFSFLARVEALHWVIGTTFFLIGLIVFWKKGQEETSLVFFLMCATMMLIFLTNATSMTAEAVYFPAYFIVMNLMNVVSTFFGAALMLHFSLLMPAKRRFLVRFPRLVPAYYACCAAIVAALSFSLMNVLFPAFFVAGLAVMTYYVFRSRDLIEKQQLKWVLAGFASGLLPFVLINGIPMMITGHRLINDTIPGLFLISIPLFTAFAIQKSHLMDIDSIFDNTLIYGATFGILTMVDLAVAGFFSRILPDTGAPPGFLAGIAGLWFLVIAYVPVRNRLRRWLDHLLKREQYVFQDVSARLGAALMLASDTPAALHETIDTINETLHPAGSCVYLFSDDSPRCLFGDPAPDLLQDALSSLRSLGAATYLYRFAADGLAAPGYESGVVFPLIGQAGNMGLVLLGNKVTNRPYGGKDLSLLNMVGRHLSLALENVAAKEKALAKERESREIKERISREMHDGIGGIFSNAIMMLDMLAAEGTGKRSAGKRVAAVRDTLTDGLAETRALITTMEEKETVLGDMKDDIEDNVRRLLNGRNIEHAFSAEIDNYNLPLSPLAVHNVTKIVQEGITNALKHSHASKISVAVTEKDGVLAVCVSDNGSGLESIEPGSGHYGLRNVERRCSEIGAELKVESRPGRGFAITVLLASTGP